MFEARVTRFYKSWLKLEPRKVTQPFLYHSDDLIGQMQSNATDAFFAQLPGDAFLSEEMELLVMITKIGSLLETWLPPGIGLQEWVDRRVPGQFAQQVHASRVFYVCEANSSAGGKGAVIPAVGSPYSSAASSGEPKIARPSNAPPAKHVHLTQQSRGANPSNSDGRVVASPSKPGLPVPRVVPARSFLPWEQSPDADYFLESLPPDEFFPWELALWRSFQLALRIRCQSPNQEGWRPLDDLAKIPSISRLILENLPQNVSLALWMEHRLSSEFAFDRHQVKSCSSLSEEDYTELIQDSIDALPEDIFTPEEEVLRSAVIEFLQQWPSKNGDIPATTADLGAWPAVSRARPDALPFGVSLSQWCEHRIHAEVEILKLEGSTNIAIALRGQMNYDAVRQLFHGQGRKRKLPRF